MTVWDSSSWSQVICLVQNLVTAFYFLDTPPVICYISGNVRTCVEFAIRHKRKHQHVLFIVCLQFRPMGWCLKGEGVRKVEEGGDEK